MRKIIHVDMDAFYASVEQRDNPAYRGKPVVVGGRPEQRGAVAAASYEARKFGIHSAMPSRIAIQHCRDLIFVPPRFEVYKEVSGQIREIFHQYTDLVEPLSLDEAYLDVTENKRAMGSAVAIARAIKADIQRTTHLTASAGVSINKFLAKVASGMNKPNGLTLIPPETAADFVATLPIEKFHGIGRVTAQKMWTLGIRTGADLRQWSEADLVQRFGKVGRFYAQVARAEDHRPVNPNRIRKSIGAERSFPQDLIHPQDLITQIGPIAAAVSERLEQQQQRGYRLTLKIRYTDYQQITRSRTLAAPIHTHPEIQQLARELLLAHWQPSKAVRLLGITLSSLTPLNSPQYIQLRLDMDSPGLKALT